MKSSKAADATLEHDKSTNTISTVSLDTVLRELEMDPSHVQQIPLEDINSSKYNGGSTETIENKLLTNVDFEDIPQIGDTNWMARNVVRIRLTLIRSLTNYSGILKIIFFIVIGLVFGAYFIWSHVCRYTSEDDYRLTWMTCLTLIIIFWSTFGDAVKKALNKPCNKCYSNIRPHRKLLTRCFIGLCGIGTIGVLIWIGLQSNISNFISLIGMAFIVFLGYITSYSPGHIRWRPVITGIFIQFILALVILRLPYGAKVFQFLGDRISEFLAHTNVGSMFVFGSKYEDHFFAFKIMPIIIFFSMFTSIMYHLGAMQVIILKLAWIMQSLMGTTAGESVNAAANIFLGQTEAPLTIRPIMGLMTNSELHAVMSGGFATIAGGVFAAYTEMGVPPNHLLAASVMSAPAALAMSKLIYPETKRSRTTFDDVKKMESSGHSNILEAAAVGATQSISMVANIIATLIAFIAALDFFNATLTWFGERACLKEPLTFQLICSYVLWPMAFLMGVPKDDCFLVAELIGVKTFLNEFIAYEKLGKLTKNRKILESLNSTMLESDLARRSLIMADPVNGATLGGAYISKRAEMIATYALCGFANFGSLGIMLNGLGNMAPHRSSDLSEIALRALLSGTLACFLTACIAGVCSP